MLIFNSSSGASFEKRCADDERGEEKFWFEKLINTKVDGRFNDCVSKMMALSKLEADEYLGLRTSYRPHGDWGRVAHGA